MVKVPLVVLGVVPLEAKAPAAILIGEVKNSWAALAAGALTQTGKDIFKKSY